MNNTPSKWALGLLISVAILFSTGFKVKTKYFGEGKTYAVVTVQSVSTIKSDTPSGGVAGLIRSFKKKQKFSENSSGVLKESLPQIMTILERSKSFSLMPQDKVLGHAAYTETESDKKGKLSRGMLVAEGYKYIKHKSKNKLKDLVVSLGVDGVIVMYVTYKVTFRGIGVSSTNNPFAGAAKGTQKGLVYINIWAYNNKGDLVWKNTEWGRSEGGLESIGGGTDFKEIQPFIIEAAKIAAKKQVEKLDNKVGG